ncbi:FecCD family ABC transporter permease [Falsirhodobacter halotolerans]|uniref:FecCD family ABC transporter permease n=1 Tax=Falsirhodobacter halotolerans TaxID=1146892 RepID=UPI001FD39E5B|nr:iron ABC transporter permease [Falsirhodobacter halotolerans]MCJ8140122.1 iron ABC transporter permease [Falsirhodobacter halotolerans]
MTTIALSAVRADRRARRIRRTTVLGFLSAVLLALFAFALSSGQSFTPPLQVLRVLMGEEVPGASFTVGQLRLPRAVLAVLAGMSFGMGGAAFQTMLRNPLASPDIIGINLGASAAAVFGIVVLGLDGAGVSVFAIVAGLGVALTIFGLSWRGGISGTRLILVGIGVAAMLESFISYVLSQAPAWDMQEAMRWMSGSVNAAQMDQALPVLAALVIFGGALLVRAKDLEVLTLGDDMAAALGTPITRTRIVVMIASVGLIAVATAATGPILFVAFLSAPIAVRLTGHSGSSLIPAGLVGATLVLAGDHVGQFLLPARYPVGVVTAALGAPYLIYLIIRTHGGGRA